jgi:hypothetical protein
MKKYKALLVVSLVLMVGISPVVLGAVKKGKLSFLVDGKSTEAKLEKDGSVWVKLPKGAEHVWVTNANPEKGKLIHQNVEKLNTNMSLADVEKIFGAATVVTEKKYDKDGNYTFEADWADDPKDLENLDALLFSDGSVLGIDFKNGKIEGLELPYLLFKETVK